MEMNVDVRSTLGRRHISYSHSDEFYIKSVVMLTEVMQVVRELIKFRLYHAGTSFSESCSSQEIAHVF